MARVASSERDNIYGTQVVTPGLITGGLTKSVSDPVYHSTCWLSCISPLDVVTLAQIELPTSSSEAIISVRSEIIDQYCSSLFGLLTFLFAD